MHRLILKILFNLLNNIVPSSLFRANIFKLFGSKIGKKVKIEKILLVNFDGINLNKLEMGDNTYIGTGSILDLREKIIIGKSTKIAPGCNFSTHEDCGQENAVSQLYPIIEEKIKIGNHTWIGLNTTILCGCNIGDNSVIGAGTLVNKNIPSKVLAFGTPVKIIKKLNFH